MQTSLSVRAATAAVCSSVLMTALASCVREGVLIQGGAGPFKEKAERVERHSLELREGETLILKPGNGAIQLEVSSQAPPGITSTLTVHATTQEEASRILEQFHLKVERAASGSVVRVEGEPVTVSTAQGTFSISPSVRLEILAPPGIRVEAETKSGAIRAHGPLASCDLATSFGDVVVEDVAGDARIRSKSGSIHLSKARGGRTDVETGFGSVTLKEVAGEEVRAESKSGDITLEDASKGSWSLDSGFGRIRVSGGSGTLKAKSSSGSVEVTGFQGEAKAQSGFGAVKLDGIFRLVTASSKSGAVEVSARAGSEVGSDWTVESGFGGVTLDVPATLSFRLEAETKFGSIRSDLPLQVEGGALNGKSVRGVIGSGGGRILLKTQSGDIRLGKWKE